MAARSSKQSLMELVTIARFPDTRSKIVVRRNGMNPMPIIRAITITMVIPIPITTMEDGRKTRATSSATIVRKWDIIQTNAHSLHCNQEAHSMDHFFVANMEQCHTITVAEQVEDADMYVPWSFDVHQLDVELIEEEDSIEFEREVAFEGTMRTNNEMICSENHSIGSVESSGVSLCRLCTKVLCGIKELDTENSQELKIVLCVGVVMILTLRLI
jgi:hypothetical protein